MACSYAEWLLLVFILLPHAAVGTCSARVTVSVGVFFRCQLDSSDFSFNSNAGPEGGPIRSYRLYQEGHAGRPEWIQATLAPPARENLILYGTPTDQDLGQLQLQVLVQRNNFQTSNVRTIHLTVEPLQGLILLTVDLFITNLNLDEMLTDSSYTSLQRALTEVYSVSGGPEPQIITLIDPRDRNIEAPEPPQRIGVVVQFTPGVDISSPVSTTSQQNASTVQSSCNSPSDLPLPPENFNQFLAYGLTVDWCQYAIQDVATPSTSTAGSSDAPPTVQVVDIPSVSESNLVLIVIAVVVGVVICISICVLTCVCFCKRRNSILTLPWTKRFEKTVMLQETKLSVGEVKRTQLLLRHLSSTQDVGVVQEPEGEQRPQSTETACLEYQDMPGGRDVSRMFGTPPPAYCYDERLAEITRSSTPSS